MDAIAVTQPRRTAARALLVAGLAAVIAIAAYGASLIPGTFGNGQTSPQAARPLPVKSVYALGDQAPVTFGALAVHDARTATGLTSQQLGGMTHGISGLIDATTAQLQVSMTLTNSTYVPAGWSAADMRVEAARSGRLFAPIGGTKERGTLQPGTSLDLTLNYVVPRNGDHFTLTVRNGARVIRFHLIQVGKAPPGTKGFLHAHGLSTTPAKKKVGTKQ